MFNSREEATASDAARAYRGYLDSVGKGHAGEFVRLLRVASTQQLKLLCGESERNVGETAELYLEVAPTCPLFYAQ